MLHIFYILINAIYICLSVCPCLSVCIQQTSKRLNRSGPNFVWNLKWPQERFMDAQNYKNVCPKVFCFLLNFENALKNIILLLIAPREDAHRWALIKKWNRRCRPKSPKSLVYHISTSKLHSTKHSWSSPYKSLLTCKHQLIILVSPNC